MLVVFGLVVVTVFFLGLHALLMLFLLDALSEDVHELYDLGILGVYLLQGILRPAVGLSAHIHEYIAVRDSHYILGAGLIVMKVNAAAEEIGYLRIVAAAHYLPCPVVLGERNADNTELAAVS